MPRRKAPPKPRDWLFPNSTQPESLEQSTLLDVVDTVLNKGAVLNGDVVLGVANVDLVYVKLSVLLGALDRVMDYQRTHKKPSPKLETRRRTRRKAKKR